MPDAVLILKAMAVAGVSAAAVLLVFGWPWRTSRPAWTSLGSALGASLGFFLGRWILEGLPHWPPREVTDRLFVILLPTLLGVELIAALCSPHRWLVRLLRFALAAAAAPVLLHHSIYVTDLAGPGSREWTLPQAMLILAGLAVALAFLWSALALLAQRAAFRSVPLALSVACAGAAVSVMLSGYATGGQLGLPLAAALAVAAVASWALAPSVDLTGSIGVGVVGLFSLLVMGRFFGDLSTLHAAILFAAPLACWIPELAYLRRLGPKLRGVLRIGLTAVPVVIAVALAQSQFVADSAATPSSTPAASEPSLQDYMNFGK